MTGQRLKDLRAALDVTQEALAQVLGVSLASLNRWMNDRTATGPHGNTRLILLTLEAAVERDPAFGRELQSWILRGQPYTLEKIFGLAVEFSSQGTGRPQR